MLIVLLTLAQILLKTHDLNHMGQESQSKDRTYFFHSHRPVTELLLSEKVTVVQTKNYRYPVIIISILGKQHGLTRMHA